MVLGVMSDTHGNRKLMHQVADLMTDQLKVQLILHLGDDYPDAQELALSGRPVRMVPGLWCDAYHNARIPKRIVEDFDGLKVAMAHADKDLRFTETGRSDYPHRTHAHACNTPHRTRHLYEPGPPQSGP